jgi:hypothetical protein
MLTAREVRLIFRILRQIPLAARKVRSLVALWQVSLSSGVVALLLWVVNRNISLAPRKIGLNVFMLVVSLISCITVSHDYLQIVKTVCSNTIKKRAMKAASKVRGRC